MQTLSTIVTSGVFASALTKMLTSEIFIVFLVIAVGYLIGRINIKGVSMGSSGVFISALVAGILIQKFGKELGINWMYSKSGGSNELTIIRSVRDIGLGMFVAGIGFIAGPTFFRNFKKKAGAYIGIGASITAIATIFCILFIALDKSMEAYQGVGILMGGLSTTPGLASAQNVFNEKGPEIAALYGLTYPIGVLAVVLFVQVMPKILRADMKKEVEILKSGTKKQDGGAETVNAPKTDGQSSAVATAPSKPPKKLFKLDSLGICIFSFAVALGMIVGAITIPLGGGLKFSLGTTGGALMVGLVFAHFGKIGRISLEVPKVTLSTLRELGLIMFLTGSGIEGGFKFIENVELKFLIYGVLIAVIPLICGYFIARYVFKLNLLNNLGAICGGMTSTPALGALIQVSGTEDVAQAYAAAYPFTLLMLVFVPQVIYFIF